ncbi:unnamed protein product, partial [Nippostrongylus brasiliensis]|uniref:Phlebovirus_G2 domain-containing protein n=1 Tax=Nippostrongylus brasiliensis TaxID=27835 RepID=A0A0N4XPH2_NIPBR
TNPNSLTDPSSSTQVSSSFQLNLSHCNSPPIDIGVRLGNPPQGLDPVYDLLATKNVLRSLAGPTTRCRGMGSCTDKKCETMQPTEVPPDLNDETPTPAYTACSLQCTGVNCLCAIPFRACTFYRLKHMPLSEKIFEIFRCTAWQPIVMIEISVQVYNHHRKGVISLLPYTTKKYGDLTLSVVSIQTPFMNIQRFALSENETFALPDDIDFAVACSSQ